MSKIQKTRNSTIAQITILLFSSIIAFLVIWKIPIIQTQDIIPPSGKTKFELENDARKTLVQTLGGLFFFVTTFFTWKNFQTAESNYQLTEDKQVTERFSKSIEMLGSEKIEVRLGGIYSLERISGDSDEDYEPIMKVITAFIRSKSDHSVHPNTRLASDIQAALEVIRRSNLNEEKQLSFDLSHSNLSGASMSGIDLTRANLEGSDLRNADLSGSNLSVANLENADLRGTKFQFSNLKDAKLKNIQWDQNTGFPDADNIKSAREMSDDLKRYLDLIQ